MSKVSSIHIYSFPIQVLKQINASGETVDDVINKRELQTALDEAVVQVSDHVIKVKRKLS